MTTTLPVGDYRTGAGEFANVAKHRLAADVYGALTWLDPETGIDLSNVVGFTFNAENEETEYRTGTEFHWEGALTKTFPSSVSVGLLGYYYNQLTADSGPGARLGSFEGEVAAVGATLGYTFKVGEAPVATRVRYYHEFEATNLSYDGGYRTPFIAWAPGRIAAGGRTSEILSGIDLLPTCCAMGGVPLPAGVTLDGVDVSNVLMAGAKSPHDQILLFNNEDVVAVRTPDRKYVDQTYDRGRIVNFEQRGDFLELYDARRDISESYSVAENHADVVKDHQFRLEMARRAFEPFKRGIPAVYKRMMSQATKAQD